MKRKSSSGRVGAVILSSVILVLLLVMILFFWKNSTPSTVIQTQVTATPMKTYINTKYGYQISYPETLAIREFPDSKTGAGFRPKDKPNDPQYDVITIDALPKTGNIANLPLADYAKIGASQEIQNYTRLNSIKTITTTSGIVGYETTWHVAAMTILSDDGKRMNKDTSSVSLPITYFALPASNPPSVVHVTLSDEKYQSQYTQMLSTFTLVE